MRKIINAPYFKIESFGAVDGPGIRMVLFLQGCPYRCIYCHNPESWDINGSKEFITPDELFEKFKKNESYYKENGGITLSGGEPLIHYDFCLQVCKIGYEKHISIALDTSGVTFTKNNLQRFEQLVKYNPLWLIDIKHINPNKHKSITGFSGQPEVELIKFLEKHKQKYWIRQVLVPKYTDDLKDLATLGKFLGTLKYMVKFELLPYHTLGLAKYENLHIKYPLKGVKEPSKTQLSKVMKIINKNIKLGKA